MSWDGEAPAEPRGARFGSAGVFGPLAAKRWDRFIARPIFCVMFSNAPENARVGDASQPELEGIVLSRSSGALVEISVCIDDGVRKGMRFHVFDDRTRLGHIEIIKILADKSVARIVEEDLQVPMRRGDRVTSRMADSQVSAELWIRKPQAAILSYSADNARLAMHIPGRLPLTTGQTVRLTLSKIPEYEGVELSMSIELVPVTQQTKSLLKHIAIPLDITREDIDQAISGNLVTKVVYLPNPKNSELVIAGVETLWRMRLDRGVDPDNEGRRRGALRLGNRTKQRNGHAPPRTLGA